MVDGVSRSRLTSLSLVAVTYAHQDDGRGDDPWNALGQIALQIALQMALQMALQIALQMAFAIEPFVESPELWSAVFGRCVWGIDPTNLDSRRSIRPKHTRPRT